MTEAREPRWNENRTGRCPDHFRGTAKRVFVQLRGEDGVPIIPKDSWQAHSTRSGPATDWRLTGSKFDITHWKEAK